MVSGFGVSMFVLTFAGFERLALFARMETAELQGQTSVVLDSALRLCATQASSALLEVASSRIFRHAGNTQAFHSVVHRVNAEAQRETGCAQNLRLARVGAIVERHPLYEELGARTPA